MKRIISVATLALLATTTLSLCAQAKWVDGTQKTLQARLVAGAKSGHLSAAQVTALQTKLNEVHALVAKINTPGAKVSKADRAKIEAQADTKAAAITKEMNDLDAAWDAKNKGAAKTK